MMREISPKYPQYDLSSNKGYSAPKHIAALKEHGPTPLHRRTFAPVWMAEQSQELLAFMADENLELEQLAEHAGIAATPD
jgi:ribonuclease HII